MKSRTMGNGAMKRRLTSGAFSVLVLGGALLAAAPAEAQQLCLVRGEAVAQLKQQYGEQAVAMGLVDGGESVIELFADGNGGWTLLRSHAEGHTCVIGSGIAWRDVAGRGAAANTR